MQNDLADIQTKITKNINSKQTIQPGFQEFYEKS